MASFDPAPGRDGGKSNAEAKSSADIEASFATNADAAAGREALGAMQAALARLASLAPSVAGDDIARDAALYALARLGAAAGRVPEALSAAHPAMPWPAIADLADLALVTGPAPDRTLMGNTLEVELPALAAALEAMIAASDMPGVPAAEDPEAAVVGAGDRLPLSLSDALPSEPADDDNFEAPAPDAAQETEVVSAAEPEPDVAPEAEAPPARPRFKEIVTLPK